MINSLMMTLGRHTIVCCVLYDVSKLSMFSETIVQARSVNVGVTQRRQVVTAKLTQLERSQTGLGINQRSSKDPVMEFTHS